MRILMVSSDFLPQIGGVAAHIYNLSLALRNVGHDITVLNVLPAQDQEGVEDLHGLKCWRISSGAKGKASNYAKKRRALLGAYRQIQQEHGPFDIIHQHDWMDSNLALRKLRQEARWIWTNHSSGFVMGYERLLKRYLIKAAYSPCDGIITVSDEIQSKSTHLWPRIPVSFIPNGVDIQAFNNRVVCDRAAYSLNQSDFVVLCPRRMVKKNGVEYLARAVSMVVRDAPDVRWKFVFIDGDSRAKEHKQYVEDVRAILREPYISDHIRILGGVPVQEMPALNAVADVVAIPSLIEAVSLSALEAMAMMKPVIATYVGGLGQLFETAKTGLLVPPANEVALAETLIKLARSPGLRAKLAENAYNVVCEQYPWSKIADSTLQFYGKVISRGAKPTVRAEKIGSRA